MRSPRSGLRPLAKHQTSKYFESGLMGPSLGIAKYILTVFFSYSRGSIMEKSNSILFLLKRSTFRDLRKLSKYFPRFGSGCSESGASGQSSSRYSVTLRPLTRIRFPTHFASWFVMMGRNASFGILINRPKRRHGNLPVRHMSYTVTRPLLRYCAV